MCSVSCCHHGRGLASATAVVQAAVVSLWYDSLVQSPALTFDGVAVQVVILASDRSAIRAVAIVAGP